MGTLITCLSLWERWQRRQALTERVFTQNIPALNCQITTVLRQVLFVRQILICRSEQRRRQTRFEGLQAERGSRVF